MRKTMPVLVLALTLGTIVHSNSAFAFGFGHFGPGLGLAHFGPGMGLAHFGPGLARFGGGQSGPHFGSGYFGRGLYGGHAYGGYGFRIPYRGGYGLNYGASGYDSELYDGGYVSDVVNEGVYVDDPRYDYADSPYYTTSGRNTRQIGRAPIHRRAPYRGHR